MTVKHRVPPSTLETGSARKTQMCIRDSIYIARIPETGTAALGAVGLCFPIVILITAFSNLFGTGGAPLFSIARGQKNTVQAGKILNTSFFLLSVCSLLLLILGFLFARPLLVMFGASDQALVYACLLYTSMARSLITRPNLSAYRISSAVTFVIPPV